MPRAEELPALAPAPGGGSSRPAAIAVALCIAAATVAGYRQVGGADFVFDDEHQILGNPWLQGGLTLTGIRWAATTFYEANWHPVTWISHLMDVQFFGLDPRGHHAVNVLLHLAASLLLFSALRALTGALGKSAAVAALFALHPIRVESVAWVSERKDLLGLLFGFAALRVYASWVRRPRIGAAAGLTALFALGLMSKPILVTFPFVLLLLDRWPLQRPPTARLVVEKAPLFLLAGGSCVMTLLAQTRGGAAASLEVVPLNFRLSNAVISYARYLGKVVVPRDLGVYYPLPDRLDAPWLVTGAFLLLTAITVGAILLARRNPALIVGWLWYLGSLVPMIGLVQVGGQAMADRYLSLPLVGLAVASVWWLGELVASHPCWRPPLVAAGLATLGLLTLATSRQVGTWRDCETLFSRALSVTEDNWMMRLNLGNCLSEKGRVAEAAREYAEAVRIRPRLAGARNNYALALADLGRKDEAFAQYRVALSLVPDYSDALIGLGLLLAGQGNAGEAAALYRRALAVTPGRSDAHLYLARTLDTMGRRSEALQHYREAVRLQPDFIKARRTVNVLR